MRQRSKRYRATAGKIASPKLPKALTEAVDLVKAHANAKFDESVDLVMRLNIDTRKQTSKYVAL